MLWSLRGISSRWKAKDSNAMSESIIWIQEPAGELDPTRNTLLYSPYSTFNFCFQILVVSQQSSQFCSSKLFLCAAHSSWNDFASSNNTVLGDEFFACSINVPTLISVPQWVHDRNKILHFKMHLMPSHVTLGHMLSAKLVHQEKKNLEE